MTVLFFFTGVIAGLFFTGSTINHGFICLVVLWSGAGLVVAQRLPRTTTAAITATAATRPILQLMLVKGFKLYSFQLQDPKGPLNSIYCHFLAVSGLGNCSGATRSRQKTW
jgi:hypothetical protein